MNSHWGRWVGLILLQSPLLRTCGEGTLLGLWHIKGLCRCNQGPQISSPWVTQQGDCPAWVWPKVISSTSSFPSWLCRENTRPAVDCLQIQMPVAERGLQPTAPEEMRPPSPNCRGLNSYKPGSGPHVPDKTTALAGPLWELNREPNSAGPGAASFGTLGW